MKRAKGKQKKKMKKDKGKVYKKYKVLRVVIGKLTVSSKHCLNLAFLT